MDEVFDDREGLDVRRRKRGKSLSLGCPGRHPLFLQQVSVCFQIRFVHAICAILERLLHLGFHFSFMHHAGMRWSLVDL